MVFQYLKPFLQASALVQAGGNLTAFFPPLLHMRSQWWTQGFPTEDSPPTAQPSGSSAGGNPEQGEVLASWFLGMSALLKTFGDVSAKEKCGLSLQNTNIKASLPQQA